MGFFSWSLQKFTLQPSRKNSPVLHPQVLPGCGSALQCDKQGGQALRSKQGRLLQQRQEPDSVSDPQGAALCREAGWLWVGPVPELPGHHQMILRQI